MSRGLQVPLALWQNLTSSSSFSMRTYATQRLYLGNVPYKTNEDDIREVFMEYGPVHDVHVVRDKDTRDALFAFLTLEQPQAAKCITQMHGRHFLGRKLVVSAATSEKASSTRRHQQSEHTSGTGQGTELGKHETLGSLLGSRPTYANRRRVDDDL